MNTLVWTLDIKININTFEISTNYYGILVVEEAGEYPFNGLITGKITDDLNTFNGILLPDYEDSGIKFTATKWHLKSRETGIK